MEKKINRFIKLYPWYAGLTSDLLFYVAIGSLFLSAVKGYTAAEIVSLTTVSTIATILLQFPLLWVIERIGNTRSARLSGFFLLLSSLFYTFGPNYFLVMLGGIFLNISTTFRQVSFVTLENNLEFLGRREEFMRIRAAGNNVYAILTMLISFIASFLFNFHHYLPMLCCIGASLGGFIISFYMVDYSNGKKPKQGREKPAEKMRYNALVLLAIAAYGIFFALATNGQSEQKLLIQELMLLDFDVDKTALLLGLILAVSRIVRVISNSVFVRIYEKMKMRIGFLLTGLMLLSFLLSMGGALLPHPILKFSIMGIGYVIILFARDPFTLYTQDIIFEYTPKEQHLTLITLQRFGAKLAAAGISTASSLLLLRFSLRAVMGMMGLVALLEIGINLKLYRSIKIKD